MTRCIHKILFYIALWSTVCVSDLSIMAQPFSNIQSPATYLQNESILDMVEGPLGFVWIATNRNLYRFDGQTMTTFLSGNFNDIEVYPQERFMLFSNREEVFRYYYETEILESIDELGLSNILSTTFHDGNIWIGASHLLRFNPESKHLDTITINERGYKNFSIGSILVDRFDQNTLWLGTSNGLVKYHISDKLVKPYQFRMTDDFLTSRVNLIACLYQHTNQDVFIGTWHGGVIRFNPQSEQYSHFFVQTFFETPTDYRDHVYTIFSDPDEHLWFTSVCGTMKLDGQSLQPLLHQSPNHKITITDIGPRMIDQERRQWKGYFWGLQILNPSASSVSTTKSTMINVSRSWNIPKAHLEDLTSETTYLHFGSSDGLYVWKRKKDTWSKVEVDPDLGLNGLDVVDLVSVQNKQWILTKTGLLTYQSGESHIQEVNWFNTPQILLRHMVMDTRGIFWINTDNGIYLADPSSRTFRHCTADPKLKPYDFLNKKADEISFDQLGQLWIALQDSIYIFHPTTEEVRTFSLTSNGGDKLGQVLSFQELDSTMWIGTTNALFNTSIRWPGEIRMIRNSFTRNLVFDQQRNLWFSSRQNLHRLYLDDHKEESYSVLDGLPDPGRYGYEYLGLLHDGMIILLTRGDISLIDPVSFTKRVESRPAPYINSLRAAGIELVLDTNLIAVKDIVLAPQQRSLDITFSAIAFDQPQSVNYRYMMEGLDEEWRYTQAGRHEVSYLNLNAGEYSFLLNARYTNQSWGEPRKLTIKCKQTLFENRWVWFGMSMLLLGSFLMYLRYRIDQEKAKQTQLHHLNDLERKALTAQMNPHFIFNAMTSIQHLISTGEHELAQDYLNKFARLLRGVFEASKQLQITLEVDISIIENYIALEALRFDDSFDYTIELEPSLEGNQLMVPALIAQPIIENAIHHGLARKQHDGHLNIRISDVNDHIEYTIKDNGVGRSESVNNKSVRDSKTSSGIRLTESRLKAGSKRFIPEHLSVEDLHLNGKPAGTLVRFRIPKVYQTND